MFKEFNKKSLKIPKGQSESVYRRRTDNTMAKRKSTKGQTTIKRSARATNTKCKSLKSIAKGHGHWTYIILKPCCSGDRHWLHIYN